MIGRRLGAWLLGALLAAVATAARADAGAGDGSTADAATDGGGDGGWHTLSGAVESGCTCAPPGAAPPRRGALWLLSELLSSRE
jgi:hypothetical protein